MLGRMFLNEERLQLKEDMRLAAEDPGQFSFTFLLCSILYSARMLSWRGQRRSAEERNYVTHTVYRMRLTVLFASKKKVKFSHTCYRALGPELIPVYRQSARR